MFNQFLYILKEFSKSPVSLAAHFLYLYHIIFFFVHAESM